MPQILFGSLRYGVFSVSSIYTVLYRCCCCVVGNIGCCIGLSADILIYSCYCGNKGVIQYTICVGEQISYTIYPKLYITFLVQWKHSVSCHDSAYCDYYTTKLLGRILVLLGPSVHLSVRQSRIPCLLGSAYSSRWIHFIFIHLIKQLQKVCCM